MNHAIPRTHLLELWTAPPHRFSDCNYRTSSSDHCLPTALSALDLTPERLGARSLGTRVFALRKESHPRPLQRSRWRRRFPKTLLELRRRPTPQRSPVREVRYARDTPARNMSATVEGH